MQASVMYELRYYYCAECVMLVGCIARFLTLLSLSLSLSSPYPAALTAHCRRVWPPPPWRGALPPHPWRR